MTSTVVSTTSRVLQLPVTARTVSLREAYGNGIRETYNAMTKVSLVDTRTMVAYLSAATIAFRVTGDEDAAEDCEQAAHRLMADWTSFTKVMPALYDQLMA